MIGCHELVLHLEDLSDVLDEPRGELRSVVGDQMDCRSLGKHPVVHELLRNVFSGDAEERYSTY